MTTSAPARRVPRSFKAMNKVIVFLQKLGFRLGGMQTLTVRGRRSGKPRTTPLTVMTVDRQRYVVGGYPGSDWIANVRAAGEGTLATHRKKETVRLVEIPPERARGILREIPAQAPVGAQTMVNGGIVKAADPEEFSKLADRCVIFRLDKG